MTYKKLQKFWQKHKISNARTQSDMKKRDLRQFFTITATFLLSLSLHAKTIHR